MHTRSLRDETKLTNRSVYDASAALGDEDRPARRSPRSPLSDSVTSVLLIPSECSVDSSVRCEFPDCSDCASSSRLPEGYSWIAVSCELSPPGSARADSSGTSTAEKEESSDADGVTAFGGMLRAIRSKPRYSHSRRVAECSPVGSPTRIARTRSANRAHERSHSFALRVDNWPGPMKGRAAEEEEYGRTALFACQQKVDGWTRHRLYTCANPPGRHLETTRVHVAGSLLARSVERTD